MSDHTLNRARDWLATDIIDIEPGKIRLRGYPVEELIGRVSFPATIWLMLRGELPSRAQAALLEAVLVSAVDHGPQAPAIAVARMAATCGVGINSAMASGINVLGDVHGGAGEQCMELLSTLRVAREGEAAEWLETTLKLWTTEHGRYVPGFGHRFHPIDPRTVRLTELLRVACAAGTIEGRYLDIGEAVERALVRAAGKSIPMNIDGISAIALLELGFPPSMGRGLFILSRSVGICAHAWEEAHQGKRIKGPTPPDFGYSYTGRSIRHYPGTDAAD
jgi:citrate synthase